MVAVALVTACTAPRTLPETPRTLTFQAALEPPFSDSAVIAGDLTVLADRLEIVVRHLEYYNRRGHGTPSPDSLKVALVSRGRLEVESSAVPLVPALRSHGDARAPTQFVIALRPGQSLSGRWLSFMFPMNSRDEAGNLIRGYYFAETDRDIFRSH